ncbi:MAG: hypothetical protein K8S62_04180 [Candidatus Sabulitectum sp.]|nr:hypothetical protein [Candidatus Sabulitectum sp.]
MKIVIISLIFMSTSSFSAVLLSDDFNDGNADGWLEVSSGASYTVESGRYCFTHTAPDTVWGASLNSDLTGVMSVPDYSCRANVVLNEGTMVGVVGRADAILTRGYALIIDKSGSTSCLILVKVEGIAQGEVLAYQPGTFTSGQEYWLRLEMNGNLIGGKCWIGDAGNEPDVWDLTATDNSFQDPGVFALFGFGSDSRGSAAMALSFDDIEITDETSLALQGSSWAFIKAMYGLN